MTSSGAAGLLPLAPLVLLLLLVIWLLLRLIERPSPLADSEIKDPTTAARATDSGRGRPTRRAIPRTRPLIPKKTLVEDIFTMRGSFFAEPIALDCDQRFHVNSITFYF